MKKSSWLSDLFKMCNSFVAAYELLKVPKRNLDLMLLLADFLTITVISGLSSLYEKAGVKDAWRMNKLW